MKGFDVHIKSGILAALMFVVGFPALAAVFALSHGHIQSIDRTNMTITITQDRTVEPVIVYITPQTRLYKNGHPAISSDLVAGDAVHGSVSRDVQGRLEGVRIYAQTANTK